MDSANDSALLTLEFGNGSQGMIHVSAVAHLGSRGQEQQVILHGEEGTIEANSSFGTGYTLRGARHDEEEIRTLNIPDHLLDGVDLSSPVMEQRQQLFQKQLIGTRLFVDAIVKDLPVSPNFNDGLRIQEVIDAALESDAQGRWISLLPRTREV